jgi:hypothetical protein
MSTLHVVAIAYERPVELRTFIDSFVMQTYTDWFMTVYHDGPPSLEVQKVSQLYKNDARIAFVATTERQGNWGHDNRRAGLDAIMGEPGDFVLITNADNYYVRTFAEKLMEKAIKGVGMVYCDFLHHTLEYINMISQPKLNYIDMGAFIVDLKIAQKVRFIHMEASADGVYCEECVAEIAKQGMRTEHVDKTLFIHN